MISTTSGRWISSSCSPTTTSTTIATTPCHRSTSRPPTSTSLLPGPSQMESTMQHATSALPDSSPLLSCTPNSVTETPMENGNNIRVPSPLMGLKPLADSDGYCVIKERMTQALRYFIDLTENNFLAQVWAPTKNGSRYVLTTSGQPFVIDPHSNGLHQYRMISLTYAYSVDEGNDGMLGLPGRVFQQRVPEWTPNVQYYSSREYPRRNHAQNYNVQGSLALPAFESSRQSCVGVFELIMTSPKINYAPEVDKVCKALEAVNLKSSEILDHPSTQICNEGRQNVLAEILGILAVVCETHKLPLAQTWVTCRHLSVLAHGGGLENSCTSFDGGCMGQVCMSTTDVALYVVDAHMCGFWEACVEHHLQKDQGVTGRAFSSHSLCFCENITLFCKTEYPLVHYARMFGLASCFAICLRSTHTGDDDYILEFFLPPSITDFYEQRTLLGSLLATMKQHFQSLKVASGVELEEEVSVEIIQVSTNESVDSRLESLQIPLSMESPPRPDGLLNKGDVVQLESSTQQLMLHFDDINDKGTMTNNGGRSVNHFSSSENKEIRKTSESKRGKTEKSLSLEVFQQYFAGSLKDAAKILGVCPSKMKCIRRQQGISRWPSRKINKVNRSLSKLKRVIESVPGAKGAFGRTLKNDKRAGMEDQWQGRRKFSPMNLIRRDHSCSPPELGKGPDRCKTRSGSCEESAGSPTSHGSCQGSLPNQSTPAKHLYISSINEICDKVGGSPDALLMTEPQETFGGMLIEDAGNSKDLRNLCPSVRDAMLDEQVPEFCSIKPPFPSMAPNQSMATPAHTMPYVTDKKEMKSVAIKATFREDIIRFRLSLSSGILELKEEVAKRLKPEMGTFDIKYLDDDNEWVLIACDADLQECIDISRSSASTIIRLLVRDG